MDGRIALCWGQWSWKTESGLDDGEEAVGRGRKLATWISIARPRHKTNDDPPFQRKASSTQKFRVGRDLHFFLDLFVLQIQQPILSQEPLQELGQILAMAKGCVFLRLITVAGRTADLKQRKRLGCLCESR